MEQSKVTIEISSQLYESINQLKQIFSEITGQKVDSDEEVLSIIVGGFIESITQEGNDSNIITDSHDCKCGGNCQH